MYFRPTAFEKHQLHLSWGTCLPGLPEKSSCSLVVLFFRMWPFWRARSLSPGCLSLSNAGMHFRKSVHIHWCRWDQQRQRGASHLLLGFINCKVVPETISSRGVDFLGNEIIWGVVIRSPNSSIYCLLISHQIVPKHKPSPTFNFKFILAVAG